MANSYVTITTQQHIFRYYASQCVNVSTQNYPLKTMEFGATTRAQSLICVNTKMAWSKIYSSDAKIE